MHVIGPKPIALALASAGITQHDHALCCIAVQVPEHERLYACGCRPDAMPACYSQFKEAVDKLSVRQALEAPRVLKGFPAGAW